MSMSTPDNGGPAFPTNTEASNNTGACFTSYGMTLRDAFALAAMQGWITGSLALGNVDAVMKAMVKANVDDPVDLFAINAYAQADAMLKARAK